MEIILPRHDVLLGWIVTTVDPTLPECSGGGGGGSGPVTQWRGGGRPGHTRGHVEREVPGRAQADAHAQEIKLSTKYRGRFHNIRRSD